MEFVLTLKKNKKQDNTQQKKFRMRYGGKQGVTLWLPFNPREHGCCEVCGKSVKNGEIKFVNIHHLKYAYRPSTVKKSCENGDYSLALDNSIVVDYYCHNMMDALRTILTVTDNKRILKGMSLLPKEHKDKLYDICKSYIEYYNNQDNYYGNV